METKPEKQDESQRVIDIVRRHWAKANIQDVEIHKIDPRFVHGPLYYLSVYDAEGVERENYVHVTSRGDSLFLSLEQLVLGIKEVKPLSLWESGLSFVKLTGIPGLLAICITFTVCFIAIRKTKNDIPELLSNALTFILGFYFSNIAQSISHSSQSPQTNRPI